MSEDIVKRLRDYLQETTGLITISNADWTTIYSAADLIERQREALREALRALEDARTAILHKCSPADDIEIALAAIDAALKEGGE